MKKKILFLMTGSIAAYKACSVVSQLHQKGFDLEIVLTKSCQEFIGPATIEGLTGKKPHTDMYESGQVMDHIHLVRWADLILVAPATANFINRCAVGIGDDFLTTLFLAHDFQKPFLIAPAMNTKMYLHPTTQESLKKLKGMGVDILETASGVLACGETGWGRLLEPQLIIDEILKRIQSPSSQGIPQERSLKKLTSQKILVTAGGTSEPLDSVRSITNTSSGKTGAQIAFALWECGFDVTLALARNHRVDPALLSLKKSEGLQTLTFTTTDDLQKILQDELTKNNYSSVIHSAAVSDYKVQSISDSQGQKFSGKIPSGGSLTVQLTPQPKLINDIKKISKNPGVILIGFKLTDTQDTGKQKEKVAQIFSAANCDYVIHNDLSEITSKEHRFHLYHSNMESEPLQNLSGLTAALIDLLRTNNSGGPL